MLMFYVCCGFQLCGGDVGGGVSGGLHVRMYVINREGEEGMIEYTPILRAWILRHVHWVRGLACAVRGLRSVLEVQSMW